jgi:threonine dehydratase
MATATSELTPARIALTERLIRPHIRRTPVVETCGADFGLGRATVLFKLESCQHAGSFKTRGAFANLLGSNSKNRRHGWIRCWWPSVAAV